MRLENIRKEHQWCYITESGSMRLLIESASLWLSHWGSLTEAASMRLFDCYCLIQDASLWLHQWINLTEQLTEADQWGCLTVAASLRLPHWGCLNEAVLLLLPHWGWMTVNTCLTVTLYLILHPSYVRCCLITCETICIFKYRVQCWSDFWWLNSTCEQIWFVLQNKPPPESRYFEEPSSA